MVVPDAVVSEVFPHRITAPEVKFVPVTVRLNPGLPLEIDVALKLVSVGPLTVKVRAFDTLPPEFCTVMETGPAVFSRVAGTVAVICVAVPAPTVARAVAPQ